MNALWRDACLAARGLRRRPGFAVLIVLTFAIGIGASTSVFSVVQGILRRPLPFPNPERLTLVWHRLASTGGGRAFVQAPDVAVFRREADRFEGFAFMGRVSDAIMMRGGNDAERVRVARVSANFFQLLGLAPAVGRDFGTTDLTPGDTTGTTAVVLSDELWRGRFGADSSIIGRVVRIDGADAIVVGVAARSFELPLPAEAAASDAVEAWLPIGVDVADLRRTDALRDQDSDNSGLVIGRLRGGVTLEQARAQMGVITERLLEIEPSYREAGLRIEVVPLHADAVAHARPVLLALLGAVGVMLVVACVNIAGVLGARAVRRRHELAVRAALGAGTSRLVRQLATETMLLATAGGALGVGLSAWTLDALLRLAPVGMPRLALVRLDGGALLFALGATMGAALLAGIVPALLAAGIDGQAVLRDRGGTSRAQARVRRGVVMLQVALAVTLVVAAGLLARTAIGLQRVELGFQPRHALAFDLNLRAAGPQYPGPAARAALMRDLERELRGVPGVEAVGLVSRTPLGGRRWTNPFGLVGQAESEWAANVADFRMVSPGYFDAIGTRMLAGRTFTEDENRTEERRVAIVDAALAERLGGGAVAVGRRIGFPLDGKPVWAEIVGVAEPVHFETLRTRGRPAVYVPYRHEASRDMSIIVRALGDPMALVPAMRRALNALVPVAPLFNARRLDGDVANAEAPTTFALRVVVGFAVLAMLLAALGVYGLLHFTVASRTREIGVRIAVGGSPRQVALHFLRSGAALVGSGVLAGLILASIGAPLLGDLLWGIDPRDVTVLSLSATLVLLGGVFATVVPVRRAARIDPLEALRNE